MKIIYLTDNETLIYSAEELKKYLNMMDSSLGISIEKAGYAPEDADTVKLGLFEQFGIDQSEIADPMIDDVIDISIKNGSGHIAGSNARSVLQGVYLYLKSAGCMWVRPGDDGEYIPQKAMASHDFVYHKKADLPFRGECIEGAVSYEHVRDTVIWLPKAGMNLFMMEQVVPYNYMSRWYEHIVNTVKEDEHVSYEEIGEYVIKLEKLIKKCGLQLHALGHGYLLEPYGIHYKKFGCDYELTEEGRQDVALVNGKRELYLGSPNFTQICMSSDKARKAQVDWLVSYIEQKPYIDFLHVWLSDAVGNHCECENCVKMRPSDFYVMLLNELDAELTKRNIGTKIVFIMYTDTLWCPEKHKFNNPDRFIMTTALSRSYNKPVEPEKFVGELPPYVRNKYSIKTDANNSGNATMIKFMDSWKPVFDGRRFSFDYYMYTDHFFDPGYFQISKVILEDARNIESLGFEGIMSDQTQRSFFPNGLPMSLIGEAQFDRRLDFDEFVDRYFKASYGDDWKECRDYLMGITELFDPCDLRTDVSVVTQDTCTGEDELTAESFRGNAESQERLARIEAYVDAFLPTIEKNTALKNICHAKSWKLLVHHARYCKDLAKIFIEVSKGDKTKATEILNSMIDRISHIEDEIAPEFDLVLFNQRLSQLINV